MYPSGTVTFLFSDIESSTKLWEQHPRSMGQALARHDTILREAIESHQGMIVKTTGDGVHAVFDTAANGLQAVLNAQLSLASEAWGETGPLRVRMALHTGEAEWRDGDYFGTSVNRAARLMAAAAGGQVLVSEATAQIADGQLPDGASLMELGQHRLRDVSNLERIFQLKHAGLLADFPPIKSISAVPNNLPVQLTSFIGRERSRREIKALLVPDDGGNGRIASLNHARLVTLIGPGGTGKTRLSLQVASELMEHFPDGVLLVELAPIMDPQLVIQAIADVLGMRDNPGRKLLDAVTDHVDKQNLLLVLDNCEHLIDECARLMDLLLRACPRLHVLASSREALGIAGEQAYRVRSLALPDSPNGKNVEELLAYEGIRLFVERAQNVKRGFAITDENATAILKVCRRLDGIPLAIELAAARVRVLSPEQIAERLDNRFQLLTGGSRTALPRQRTLQALIDWSYDLLSDEERVLLRRLSVFTGGWTLEAAEAVCGGEPLESFMVLDLLDQLVNKSLALADDSDDGLRYRMMETIRQYAQEKLAESGESSDTRNAHMTYFRDIVASRTEHFLKHGFIDDSVQIRAELDNLRGARAWALDHDLIAALHFCRGFDMHMHTALSFGEARQYLEAVFGLVEGDPQYDSPDAPVENRSLLAAAYANASLVAITLGQNPIANAYAIKGMEIARETDAKFTLVLALTMGRSSAAMLGDFESAERWRQESSALLPTIGNSWITSMAKLNRFEIALGNLDHADPRDNWQQWEEGMAFFRQSNDLWSLSFGHQMAAMASVLMQDLEKADYHARRTIEYSVSIGDNRTANMARSILAETHRVRGDLEAASNMYRQIIPVWRSVGNIGAVARCMEVLAFMNRALAENKSEQREDLLREAVTLIGAAETIRRAHASPMIVQEEAEYQAELQALREAVGEEAFTAAWSRGQAMKLEQAIVFSLGK